MALRKHLLFACFFMFVLLSIECAADDNWPAKQPDNKNLDCYGDPLPKGAIARLGTTRLRVGGHVYSLAFSPKDQFLASGSIDNTVRVWQVSTGKEVQRFGGHDPWVTSAVYSPDGNTLASAGADKVIRLWDVEAGKLIRDFKGHGGPVSCLQFSRKGDILASGSGVISGGDRTLRLWEVQTGRELSVIRHKDQVRSLAFAPDGKSILSGSEDGAVTLWDVQTGDMRRQFEGLDKHVRWIRVAFSPDGQQVAAGAGQREPTLLIWDVETGKQIHKLQGHSHFFLTSLAFSPDGKLLASGSLNYEYGRSSVFLWNAKTGKETRRFNQPKHGVSSLAFSHDGKVLAAGSNCSIHLWQVETGKELHADEAHGEMVMSVRFSPAGKHVATGGFDGSVRLWDANTGKHLRKLADHPSGVPFLTFSRDGKRLVHVGTESRVFDLHAGKEIMRLPAGENSHFIGLIDDGHVAVQYDNEGKMHLWATADGKHLGAIGVKSGRFVAASRDGKTIAFGSRGPTIQLWDVSEKKLIRSFKVIDDDVSVGGSEVRLAAFSPDGTSMGIVTEVSRSASLWDVSTGKLLRRFSYGEHEVFSLAFSPDGTLLALGNWDNTVKVFETASSKQRAHFAGHQSHIYSLAFSPDGKSLASASSDSTVLLWSVPSQ